MFEEQQEVGWGQIREKGGKEMALDQQSEQPGQGER